MFGAKFWSFSRVSKTGSDRDGSALKTVGGYCSHKQRKHTPVGRLPRKMHRFLRGSLWILNRRNHGGYPQPAGAFAQLGIRLAAQHAVRVGCCDGFVQAVLSPAPPDWARIGTQLKFLHRPERRARYYPICLDMENQAVSGANWD